MVKNSIIPASALKTKAKKFQTEEQFTLNLWVEETAANLTSWADEDAGNGKMQCKIDNKDIRDILPPAVPADKIFLVLSRAREFLETHHGYRVFIDTTFTKDKSPNAPKNGIAVITGITLDWSGTLEQGGMEMPK